jgi:glycyl-tRNA synthetase beta chain
MSSVCGLLAWRSIASQRKTQIKAQVEAAATKQGGYADITEELLEEVTDLVEWPNAVVGKFDEEFLILPPEVITTIIVTNQRYFPILKSPIIPNFCPILLQFPTEIRLNLRLLPLVTSE